MTVVVSLKRVLDEVGLDKTLDVLDGPVASADFEIRQAVLFMDQAGRDAVQRAEWPSLYELHVIPANTDTIYVLPPGTRVIGTGVSLRLADGRTARAVQNPAVWQEIKASTPDNPYVYAREGQSIECTESLDGAEVNVFGWQWVENQNVGKEHITHFDDTFRIPERLVELGAVWRWKRSKGRPYEGEFDEFERETVVQARNVRMAI